MGRANIRSRERLSKCTKDGCNFECIEKGYLNDDEICSLSNTSESMLRMPTISKDEISGLAKVFSLYTKFPKERWEEIKKTTSSFTVACQQLLNPIAGSDIAFKEESLRLIAELGPLGDQWQWKNSRGTDIYHLAKIPGLGRMHLPTGGDWNIPNATAKTHGPSWRYVVELGDKPKGYGVYPGGQSGFPGSVHYDQFLDSWVKGELYELQFPYTADEIKGHSVGFNPGDGS